MKDHFGCASEALDACGHKGVQWGVSSYAASILLAPFDGSIKVSNALERLLVSERHDDYHIKFRMDLVVQNSAVTQNRVHSDVGTWVVRVYVYVVWYAEANFGKHVGDLPLLCSCSAHCLGSQKIC